MLAGGKIGASADNDTDLNSPPKTQFLLDFYKTIYHIISYINIYPTKQ